MKLYLFIIIFSVSILSYKSAEAFVQFRDPIQVYGQCDDKDINITLSPDANAVSFLFNNSLLLESISQNLRKKNFNKRCIFRIPLKASPQIQFEIMNLDWRGFIAIPKYSEAHFRSQVWLTPTTSKNHEACQSRVEIFKEKNLNFIGPKTKELTIRQNLFEPRKVTECGKDYFLTIEVNLNLKNKKPTENAQFILDSLDLGQTLSNSIVERPCR